MKLSEEQINKALGILHEISCGIVGATKEVRDRTTEYFIEIGEDDMCTNCLHDKFPGEGCYECGSDVYGNPTVELDTMNIMDSHGNIVGICSSTTLVLPEDADNIEENIDPWF